MSLDKLKSTRPDSNRDTPEKETTTSSTFNINDVITLSRPDRTLTQRRQAAMYFAHVSTDNIIQIKIVDMKRNYGIEPLISLLQSNDSICQKFTALSIGNMASNPYCRIKLVEAQILKELFAVAVTDVFDISARRYSIFAIGNLAASNGTHEYFLDFITTIIDLLDAHDIEICRYATQVLQNLSANTIILPHLIKANMITPLINLLANTNSSSPPEFPLHSLAVLRCVSVDDSLKSRLISEGFLKELIHMTQMPVGPKVLVEAAACFTNLSTSIEMHNELFNPLNLKAMFYLLGTSLFDAHFYIIDAFANLASNQDTHISMLDNGIIKILIGQSSHTETKVRISASRALTSFVVNKDLHRDLINLDILTACLSLYRDTDSQCRLFASIISAMMSENSLAIADMRKAGFIQTLFHSADVTNESPQSGRYTILALANMASDLECHKYLLDEMTIQTKRFLQLARHKDEESRFYFSLMLSNMAANSKNHELFIDRSVLLQLCPLLTPWILEIYDDSEIDALKPLEDAGKIADANFPIVCGRIAKRLALYRTPADHNRASKLGVRHVWTQLERDSMSNTVVFFSRLLADDESRYLVCDAVLLSLFDLLDSKTLPSDVILLILELLASVTELDFARNEISIPDNLKRIIFFLENVMYLNFGQNLDLPFYANPESPDSSPDPLCFKKAMNLLDNISVVQSSHALLSKSTLFKKCIIDGFHSIYEEIQLLSLRIVSHLRVEYDDQILNCLIGFDILNLIVPFIRSKYLVVRKLSFLILGNIAANLKIAHTIPLKNINILKCLHDLAKSMKSIGALVNVDLEEMRVCIFASANLITQSENVEYLVSSLSAPSNSNVALTTSQLLPTLSICVETKDVFMRRSASKLLYNLCLAIPSHQMFADPNSWVSTLKNLIVDQDDRDTKLFAIKSLRLLTRERSLDTLFSRSIFIEWIREEISTNKYVFDFRPSNEDSSLGLDNEMRMDLLWNVANLALHPHSLNSICLKNIPTLIVKHVLGKLFNCFFTKDKNLEERESARRLEKTHYAFNYPLFLPLHQCILSILSSMSIQPSLRPSLFDFSVLNIILEYSRIPFNDQALNLSIEILFGNIFASGESQKWILIDAAQIMYPYFYRATNHNLLLYFTQSLANYLQNEAYNKNSIGQENLAPSQRGDMFKYILPLHKDLINFLCQTSTNFNLPLSIRRYSIQSLLHYSCNELNHELFFSPINASFISILLKRNVHFTDERDELTCCMTAAILNNLSFTSSNHSQDLFKTIFNDNLFELLKPLFLCSSETIYYLISALKSCSVNLELASNISSEVLIQQLNTISVHSEPRILFALSFLYFNLTSHTSLLDKLWSRKLDAGLRALLNQYSLILTQCTSFEVRSMESIDAPLYLFNISNALLFFIQNENTYSSIVDSNPTLLAAWSILDIAYCILRHEEASHLVNLKIEYSASSESGTRVLSCISHTISQLLDSTQVFSLVINTVLKFFSIISLRNSDPHIVLPSELKLAYTSESIDPNDKTEFALKVSVKNLLQVSAYSVPNSDLEFLCCLILYRWCLIVGRNFTEVLSRFNKNIHTDKPSKNDTISESLISSLRQFLIDFNVIMVLCKLVCSSNYKVQRMAAHSIMLLLPIETIWKQFIINSLEHDALIHMLSCDSTLILPQSALRIVYYLYNCTSDMKEASSTINFFTKLINEGFLESLIKILSLSSNVDNQKPTVNDPLTLAYGAISLANMSYYPRFLTPELLCSSPCIQVFSFLCEKSMRLSVSEDFKDIAELIRSQVAFALYNIFSYIPSFKIVENNMLPALSILLNSVEPITSSMALVVLSRLPFASPLPRLIKTDGPTFPMPSISELTNYFCNVKIVPSEYSVLCLDPFGNSEGETPIYSAAFHEYPNFSSKFKASSTPFDMISNLIDSNNPEIQLNVGLAMHSLSRSESSILQLIRHKPENGETDASAKLLSLGLDNKMNFLTRRSSLLLLRNYFSIIDSSVSNRMDDVLLIMEEDDENLATNCVFSDAIPESNVLFGEKELHLLLNLIKNEGESIVLRHLAASLVCSLSAHYINSNQINVIFNHSHVLVLTEIMHLYQMTPPVNGTDFDKINISMDEKEVKSFYCVDISLQASLILCNLASSKNMLDTMLQAGTLALLLSFARSVALQLPSNINNHSAPVNFRKSNHIFSSSIPKSTDKFNYVPINHYHTGSDYLAVMRILCVTISNLCLSSLSISSLDISLYLDSFPQLLLGSSAAARKQNISMNEFFSSGQMINLNSQVSSSKDKNVTVILDVFCCRQLSLALCRLFLANTIDWSKYSFNTGMFSLLVYFLHYDDALTQHLALQSLAALILKSNIPTAFLDSNNLIDVLLCFLTGEVDSATVFLTLNLLNFLSKYPVCVSQFLASSNLPNLFELVYACDFDQQSITMGLIYKLFGADLKIMKKVADRLLPALCHVCLVTSQTFSPILHPHLQDALNQKPEYNLKSPISNELSNKIQSSLPVSRKKPLKEVNLNRKSVRASFFSFDDIKPVSKRAFTLGSFDFENTGLTYNKIHNELAIPSFECINILLQDDLVIDLIIASTTPHGIDTLFHLIIQLNQESAPIPSSDHIRVLEIIAQLSVNPEISRSIYDSKLVQNLIPIVVKYASYNSAPRLYDGTNIGSTNALSESLFQFSKFKVTCLPTHSQSGLQPCDGMSVILQRSIASIIRNVCTISEHKVKVLENDILSALFRLLCGNDPQTIRQSIFGLLDVVTYPTMETILYNNLNMREKLLDGGINSFIDTLYYSTHFITMGLGATLAGPIQSLLLDGSIPEQRNFNDDFVELIATMLIFSMEALQKLSNVVDFQVIMANNGVIEALVLLYHNASLISNLFPRISAVKVSSISVSILTLICENENLQSNFVDHEGLSVISELGKLNDSATQKSVARLCSSLSARPEYHKALVLSGVLNFLVEMKNHKDAGVRKVALDTYLTVVENPSLHNILIPDNTTVKTLLAMSRYGADDVRKRSTTLAGIMVQKQAELASPTNFDFTSKKGQSKTPTSKLKNSVAFNYDKSGEIKDSIASLNLIDELIEEEVKEVKATNYFNTKETKDI